MPSSYGDMLASILNMQEQYEYIIRRKVQIGDHINGVWYLLTVDSTKKPPYVVKWTSSMFLAFKFPSEQAVEEFKQAYILPRPAEIIRIEKQ